MIAFHDHLPVIELASGQAVAFERDWLVRSLARAASRAGYAKWWLAEHVAESVTSYLREQEALNVMPVDRLTAAVQSVLQVIGYSEVAQHFKPAPHRERISLVELARSAGAGYELAFFDLLGRRIQELVGSESCDFELHGLDRCVRQLCAVKTWSRTCDALRSEIVAFTREQATAAAARCEVTFSLL
jgi:hypothetical protein